MIASRFAGRVTLLAFVGGLLGVAMAIPVLLGLASLTAPFQPQALAASASDDPGSLFKALPPLLWELLPALPVSAGLIGWITTQITVRAWLARLP
jgi:cell division transport system permease protein